MESVKAHLRDKLRPLDAWTFSLHPVVAGAVAEPSTAQHQADLLLEQPLILEHGDC